MAEQQRNNIERADKIEAKHNQAQRSRFVVEHRNIFARTRMFVEIARLAKRNINNKKSTKTNRIKTNRTKTKTKRTKQENSQAWQLELRVEQLVL